MEADVQQVVVVVVGVEVEVELPREDNYRMRRFGRQTTYGY